MIKEPDNDVLRIKDSGWQCFEELFAPVGLCIERIGLEQAIPGSHWGGDEAGLIQQSIYARETTPVHSLLHEACHWLLMSEERRKNLHTDAKGSAIEEMAVCYLQILLSEYVPGMGRDRMFLDMDRWGYSFRLGGSKAWFEEDAEDALACLTNKLAHSNSIAGLHILTPARSVFKQHNNS